MLDIPFLDLPPLLSAGGTLRLPGSKSISNRVLLLAGLCEGETLVRAPLEADDTRVMVDALATLGCKVTSRGADLRIAGIGGRPTTFEADLFLSNAGTAMRPIAAVLAVLAATRGGTYRLDGVPRMRERPIGDLVDALRRLGCRIDDMGAPGFPPIAVRGEPDGRLDLGAPVRVRGDVSSQFLTALLIALPLADTARPVILEVEGALVSRPYVEMTIELMARFGIRVSRDGDRRFVIPAGSRYRSPGAIRVEGDASSASYFVALGAIAGVERPVRIEGVGLDSIQGDIRFVDAARAMGAEIRGGDGWLEARRGAWPLKAVSLDAVAIPDAAMTLAAMALFAEGTTRIGGIASWRVKETDRIAAMADGLRRLGACIVEGDDFLEITAPQRWRPADIATFDDHRLAMCFSLAAFNALSSSAPRGGLPVRIREPRCTAKTFPDYFEDFLSLVEADPSRVPVLTVDGPTASGKGTLAAELARRLGYRLLDSGALYRLTALAAIRRGTALDDAAALAAIAASLDVRFDDGVVCLDGDDVTDDIRGEAVGMAASSVSALQPVRHALLARQRSFRRAPGLVADGRDMGTVVFPDAELKVFLVADASERAARRHAQLISRGVPANIDSLRADLETRDARDRNRSASPLEPGVDAKLLDNSSLSVALSVDRVIEWWEAKRPFASGC